MLKYKKPFFGFILVTLVVLIIAAVCLLTNPKEDINTHGTENSEIHTIPTEAENNVTHTNATIPTETVNAPKKIVSIIDKAALGEVKTYASQQVFYQDDTYTYKFPSTRCNFVIVTFDDGTEKTVKDALWAGEITIADLDAFDIRYYTSVNPSADDPFVRIIDKATFDIDNDGRLEDCYLGYGNGGDPYITYKIYISENGTGEYFDVFETNVFLRRFICLDGKLQVWGDGTSKDREKRYFDVFIRDNNVVLSKDGVELEYFGDYDVDSPVVTKPGEVQISPIVVSVNGEIMEPFLYFFRDGKWAENVFRCTDDSLLASELPKYEKLGAFPTITQPAGAEWEITVNPHRASYSIVYKSASFEGFYMFDENFVPVDVLYSPDALSNLEPGEYNVGILMEEKSQFSDEYIAMYGREASYGSWLGIFQLKVE